jgi:hypothetical protein
MIIKNKTKLTLLWEPRNPMPKETDIFEALRTDTSKGRGTGMA